MTILDISPAEFLPSNASGVKFHARGSQSAVAKKFLTGHYEYNFIFLMHMLTVLNGLLFLRTSLITFISLNK